MKSEKLKGMLQQCLNGEIKLSVDSKYISVLKEYLWKLTQGKFYSEKFGHYERVYTKAIPVCYLTKKDVRQIKKINKQMEIDRLVAEKNKIDEQINELLKTT